MQPTKSQIALIAEVVRALDLPGTTTTHKGDDSGFEISVHHSEYALPVVKLEHLETATTGPVVHQAGWTMHRIVVDRRHAKRAEVVLERHGYFFKSIAYANYAMFQRRDEAEPESTGAPPPPWDVTDEDEATLELVVRALTMDVDIVRRQTELGIVLELSPADVPVPLDPILIVSRTWDPDTKTVVALAAVEVGYSRWIEPVLLKRGYERLAWVPGGPLMLVCRTTSA